MSDEASAGGSSNVSSYPSIGATLIGGGAQIIYDKYKTDQARTAASEASQKNYDMQKEFAQHGLRWRMEDAARAGIHPVYAAGGGPSAQASPSHVAGLDQSSGSHLANMGQDISRAIHATRTVEERQMAQLQLQRAALENKLLDTQIYNLQQDQTGPPLPSATAQPGFGAYRSGDAVVVQPQRPSASSPSNPGQDAGAIADYGLVRTATGYAVVPSKDAKERIEDQAVPEAMWAWRNLIRPAISGHKALSPKEYPLPKGFDHWKWNPVAQEFQPAKRKSSPYDKTVTQHVKEKFFK